MVLHCLPKSNKKDAGLIWVNPFWNGIAQIKINTNLESKIVNIYLPIRLSICFGLSEAVLLSIHKHMFRLRNKKIIF